MVRFTFLVGGGTGFDTNVPFAFCFLAGGPRPELLPAAEPAPAIFFLEFIKKAGLN
jgi:hypothetical protein